IGVFEVPHVGVKALVSDRTGRFLYIGGGTGITSHAIDAATGALTALIYSNNSNGSATHIAIDPQNRYLFVTGNGSYRLAGYVINGVTGGLVPRVVDPFLTEGVAASFDASGKFLYVVTDNPKTLWGWVVDANSLIALDGPPFVGLMPGSPFQCACNDVA